MTTKAEVRELADAGSASPDGRSAVAIVASLWEKVEALVQLEMKLGLAEAEDKLDALKRDLFAKAIGGAIVFAGLLTLVGAVVALLAMAMEFWLSAALTGVVVVAAGMLLLRRSGPHMTLPADQKQRRTPLSAASSTQENSHGTV